jgi:hypothetical protein
MKEYIFLIVLLQKIQANYAKIIEKKIFKNAVLLTKFVFRHVSILVKVAHSRKVVYCYIVVLIAIRSGRVVCKVPTNQQYRCYEFWFVTIAFFAT